MIFKRGYEFVKYIIIDYSIILESEYFINIPTFFFILILNFHNSPEEILHLNTLSADIE